MNATDFVNTIGSAIMVPPSVYKPVMSKQYASDEEKLNAIWSMYFGEMWRGISGAVRSRLMDMCKSFKCIAYRSEYNTYLEKHGVVDRAYVDHLEHKYYIDRMECCDDGIHAVFIKGRHTQTITLEAQEACKVCKRRHNVYTHECIELTSEIVVPYTGWNGATQEDIKFRDMINEKKKPLRSN